MPDTPPIDLARAKRGEVILREIERRYHDAITRERPFTALTLAPGHLVQLAEYERLVAARMGAGIVEALRPLPEFR